MRLQRRLRAALARSLALALVVACTASGAASAASHVSYNQILNDVMCVACHESLAVAQSQESFSERAYIRLLIHQGLNQAQIEKQLVAAYGPAVLGRPPAHGFNLLIYIVPPALLGAGIVALVVTLPKWRRRSRLAASSSLAAPPPLDPADAQRLDEDLARQL